MLKEFREFALKGNAVDLAVGIIIGTSFGTIVRSLVDDIIMPPIGLLLGSVDFSNLYILLQEGGRTGPYASLAEARAAGAVTVNVGVFMNGVISFIIVAFCVFLLVKLMNRLRQKPVPTRAVSTTKSCPFCFTSMDIRATRCPHCTSQL